MTDEIVSFEVAKLASDAGFYKSSKEHGEVCGSWYNELGLLHGRIDVDEDGVELKVKYPTLSFERRKRYYLKSYYAPTQSLLQRWLREQENIHIILECQFESVKPYYEWCIKCDIGTFCQVNGQCLNYEGCLNEGLLEALKLL